MKRKYDSIFGVTIKINSQKEEILFLKINNFISQFDNPKSFYTKDYYLKASCAIYGLITAMYYIDMVDNDEYNAMNCAAKAWHTRIAKLANIIF